MEILSDETLKKSNTFSMMEKIMQDKVKTMLAAEDKKRGII